MTFPEGLQAASWFASAVAVIFTALKFNTELGLNREQRGKEAAQAEERQKEAAIQLRWKQAEAGKKLNDEMQDNEKAWNAMLMLDYPKGRKFKISEEDSTIITRVDWLRALSPSDAPEEPQDDYIRDCFDTFFYYILMLHHSVINGFVQYQDVAYPLSYYLKILLKDEQVMNAYLEDNDLERSREAMKDFRGQLTVY